MIPTQPLAVKLLSARFNSKVPEFVVLFLP